MKIQKEVIQNIKRCENCKEKAPHNHIGTGARHMYFECSKCGHESQEEKLRLIPTTK